MANHLETVCVDRFGLDLHPDLAGLPYVRCFAKENDSTDRLVVTTFSEGHRLASTYFLDGVDADGKKFLEVLRKEFGIRDLGKKSHPLPSDWWQVFSTIFRRDPNSLVHGILFPALGIKIPRVLTASLEALGAARVSTSGVKFDKLGKTTSGQPIFAKDEETADSIVATFVIDISLIRSFGRGDDGLSEAQKQLLLSFSLWKIQQLVSSPFRYRSGCDLEMASLKIDGEEVQGLNIDITACITAAGFADPCITDVYWKSDDLFKEAKDTDDKKKAISGDDDASDNDNTDV
jgi:CRISPR-associated protein Csb1